MDMTWNWPCGVAYYGVGAAWEVSQTQEYLNLLKNRVDELIDLGLPVWTINACAMGHALITLYEATGDKKYWDIALDKLEYLKTKAIRFGDGVLQHTVSAKNDFPEQAWSDTLFMAAFFMLRMGVKLKDQDVINKESTGSRTFLRVGAANYETRIWLNKIYLGRHLGGLTPFMSDITDLLGDNNRLLIYVNNTRRSEDIPSLHYDWFNFGGIHRDIELVFALQSYIKHFKCALKPNGRYDTLSIELAVQNALKDAKCSLNIPELRITNHEILIDGRTNVEIPAQPELWSPENPKLYEVSVRYNNDIVTDCIGFREISAKGNRILLNGQDIFLKGMCAHEENCKNGRSVTNQDIESMLVEAKNLGCNLLRLTHYPHSENTTKLADM